MLDDLLSVAPPDRRPPLERRLRLLDALAERSFEDEDDRSLAVEPDLQGISKALGSPEETPRPEQVLPAQV